MEERTKRRTFRLLGRQSAEKLRGGAAGRSPPPRSHVRRGEGFGSGPDAMSAMCSPHNRRWLSWTVGPNRWPTRPQPREGRPPLSDTMCTPCKSFGFHSPVAVLYSKESDPTACIPTCTISPKKNPYLYNFQSEKIMVCEAFYTVLYVHVEKWSCWLLGSVWCNSTSLVKLNLF